MDKFIEKLEGYRNTGYSITFEVSGEDGHFNKEDQEDRPYYCNIYYGDSNAPWKSGTLLGVGYGWSIDQAFDAAISNLKQLNG
jgi:hypothetical protein